MKYLLVVLALTLTTCSMLKKRTVILPEGDEVIINQEKGIVTMSLGKYYRTMEECNMCAAYLNQCVEYLKNNMPEEPNGVEVIISQPDTQSPGR